MQMWWQLLMLYILLMHLACTLVMLCVLQVCACTHDACIQLLMLDSWRIRSSRACFASSRDLFHRFGPRFPAVSAAYDKELRRITRVAAADPAVNVADFLREGIYVNSGGPSYESIVESKLMVALGADVIGELSSPSAACTRANQTDEYRIGDRSLCHHLYFFRKSSFFCIHCTLLASVFPDPCLTFTFFHIAAAV